MMVPLRIAFLAIDQGLGYHIHPKMYIRRKPDGVAGERHAKTMDHIVSGRPIKNLLTRLRIFAIQKGNNLNGLSRYHRSAGT